jgi:tetratricopeptide (TPR) repeat protein
MVRRREDAARGAPFRRTAAWVSAGLALAVLAAYGRVAGHEFIAYDDGPYITENPHVRNGLTLAGLRWACTTFHMGNWHPLTWISHMLDCQGFGLDPGPHHLVSVLLHAATAVLLFVALQRLTGGLWPSAFVAAAFALHPLRVESVAWAAERKDVLAGLFWMLVLLAWERWVRRPSAGRYAAVLVLLVLGLAAKSMLVTLPFVLLLLDVWPLGRWPARPARTLILEKVPLLAAAALFSAVTVVAQRSAGAIGPMEHLSLASRAANAATSYVAYLAQTVWPAGLSFYYPHPGLRLAAEQGSVGAAAIGAAVLLVALTALALALWRRRPYVPVGWLWYLGTLVPVIGLVQVGMQARADRYTYLPSIGLYIAVAWAAAFWCHGSRSRRRAVAIASAALLAAAFGATAVQVSHWRDSGTLARHALRATPGNYRAHNLLGGFLEAGGRIEEAAEQFRLAVESRPDCLECLRNLGTMLRRLERHEEAEAVLSHALRRGAPEARTLVELALVHQARGDVTRARAELDEALRVDPRFAEAHAALGALHERADELALAAERLETAVGLEPGLAEAWNNLGVVYERQGRLAEARARLERALAIDEGYALAHKNLGGVLQRVGDADGAARELERALALDPDMTLARFKLGAVYAGQGRLEEALAQFLRVTREDPRYAPAHFNAGNVLVHLGRPAEALPHLDRALELEPEYDLARSVRESIRTTQ